MSVRDDPRSPTRRGLLRAALAAPFGLRLGFAAGVAAVPLTPECADADEAPTPPSVEGPYFRARSPERRNLREAGTVGVPLVVTGRVRSVRGTPVARALVDVWQADGNGVYDLRGNRLRGHQFTDETGAYRIETVVPGYYPGRTRHVHVKVEAPRGPVLTTQLFLRGDPGNRRDGLYRDALAFAVVDAGSGKTGVFDFVVRTA